MFKRVLQQLLSDDSDSEGGQITAAQRQRLENKFVPGALAGRKAAQKLAPQVGSNLRAGVLLGAGSKLKASQRALGRRDARAKVSKKSVDEDLELDIEAAEANWDYLSDETVDSTDDDEDVEPLHKVEKNSVKKEASAAQEKALARKLLNSDSEASESEAEPDVVNTVAKHNEGSAEEDSGSDGDDAPAWPAQEAYESSEDELPKKKEKKVMQFRCELCPDKRLKSQADLDVHLDSKEHKKAAEALERALKIGAAAFQKECEERAMKKEIEVAEKGSSLSGKDKREKKKEEALEKRKKAQDKFKKAKRAAARAEKREQWEKENGTKEIAAKGKGKREKKGSETEAVSTAAVSTATKKKKREGEALNGGEKRKKTVKKSTA